MLTNLLQNVNKLYLVYGSTDFRKQINSLCTMIRNNYNMSPYDKSAYIFCNKKRTSIRVLCYDKNGFVLAQKTLIETAKMKFQWPRNSHDLKSITKQQLEWLLSGLKIEQKTSFQDIHITLENVAS